MARPRVAVGAVVVSFVLFLCLFNLTDFPTTWFDEGSHLNVAKTLVRYGVYADHSSDGFRYYGPTHAVGPTVMLPIAALFELFGVGLLPARLVMAAYLGATILVFHRLARRMSGAQLAWLATTLLLSSPSVSLIPYGRQALGEVPGLFFLFAACSVWFAKWEEARGRDLLVVGLLLGFSMITKPQYAIFILPGLAAAWLLNLVYQRVAPGRLFVVPALAASASLGLWLLYLVAFRGPGWVEMLSMLRDEAGGAALVFSAHLALQSLKALIGPRVYGGLLLPALLYGIWYARPRTREGQQWTVLLLMVAINLGWYVTSSIGWERYSFPGVAIGALFVTRLVDDLMRQLRAHEAPAGGAGGSLSPVLALRWSLTGWMAVIILFPALRTVERIVWPSPNTPSIMAAYLDANVSGSALIETWERELTFLTDHRYHSPAPPVLAAGVAHVWLGAPSPAETYDFVQRESPDYVLVGEFARWVGLYPKGVLAARYKRVTTIGAYELFALNASHAAEPSLEERPRPR